MSRIMQATGRSRSFVIKWRERGQHADSTFEDLPRSGRPSKVRKPLLQQLKDLMAGKRRASLRIVADTLKRDGLDLSHETVRSGARAAGLKPKRPPRKPLLKVGHKAARLRFARQHKQTDWAQYWFADEKKFATYTPPNRKNDVVWVDKNDRGGVVEPVPMVAHGAKVNAYAAFSLSGRTDIHLFTENMTALRYIDIMESTLLPATAGSRRWVYLQDRDPKHTARVTQAWLRDHVPKFVGPDEWPSHSPDLNPMENAWGVVSDRVKRTGPKTLDELKAAVTEAWREVMTDDFRRSLVESMPRRMKAVETQKGGHTTY